MLHFFLLKKSKKSDSGKRMHAEFWLWDSQSIHTPVNLHVYRLIKPHLAHRSGFDYYYKYIKATGKDLNSQCSKPGCFKFIVTNIFGLKIYIILYAGNSPLASCEYNYGFCRKSCIKGEFPKYHTQWNVVKIKYAVFCLRTWNLHALFIKSFGRLRIDSHQLLRNYKLQLKLYI